VRASVGGYAISFVGGAKTVLMNKCGSLAILALAMLCTACSGGGAPSGGGGGGGGSLSITSASFPVVEDTDLTGQLTTSDTTGTSMTFSKTGDPTRGTITSFNSNGSFTYRPQANFSGTDSFAVSVSSARGGAASATITFNISGVNDAPVAINDFFAVSASGLSALAVLPNDSDVENDTLTVTLVGTPLVGTATVNADKTVNLSLPAGYAGTSIFEYRVTDPAGLSSTAKAAVFVGTPGYRALFSAVGSSGRRDIYLSDLLTTRAITSPPATADQEIDENTFASNGSMIAYVRGRQSGTMAERQTSARLFFQRTAVGSAPIAVAAPTGTEIAVRDLPDVLLTTLVNVALSRDGRWLAFVARQAGVGSTGFSRLYLVDMQATTPTPVRIGASDHDYVWFLQWARNDNTLSYIASTTSLGAQSAVYSIQPTAPTTVTRLSQAQSTGTFITSHLRSPSGARHLIFGLRNGIPLVAVINVANPGVETTLTTNITPGEQLRGVAVSTDSETSYVAYGHGIPADLAGGKVTRVSTTAATPAVTQTYATGLALANIFSVSHDGNYAVVQRSTNGQVSGAGNSYQLAETQFVPALTNTVLDSGAAPFSVGAYGLSAERIVQNNGATAPAVRVRGALGTTLPVATGGLFGNIVPDARINHVAAFSGGDLYLSSYSSPGAWISPSQLLPGLTSAAWIGSIDLP
jgi:VCBS repeat-containing protein